MASNIVLGNGLKFPYVEVMYLDRPIAHLDGNKSLSWLPGTDEFQVPVPGSPFFCGVSGFWNAHIIDRGRPNRYHGMPHWVKSDWDEFYFTHGMNDSPYWVRFPGQGVTLCDVMPWRCVS